LHIGPLRGALSIFGFAAILATLPARAVPKKHPPPPPRPDSIDVVAHLPLPGGPAIQLLTSVHWRRDYLYVAQGGDGGVVVFDVTDPGAPQLKNNFKLPSPSVYPTAVVGTAVLATSGAPIGANQETITILSFEDPANPRIVRQFQRVTCVFKDSARGLIYLTNDEGLWILRATPATDVELQKQYLHDVLYNH